MCQLFQQPSLGGVIWEIKESNLCFVLIYYIAHFNCLQAHGFFLKQKHFLQSVKFKCEKHFKPNDITRTYVNYMLDLKATETLKQ